MKKTYKARRHGKVVEFDMQIRRWRKRYKKAGKRLSQKQRAIAERKAEKAAESSIIFNPFI